MTTNIMFEITQRTILLFQRVMEHIFLFYCYKQKYISVVNEIELLSELFPPPTPMIPLYMNIYMYTSYSPSPD